MPVSDFRQPKLQVLFFSLASTCGVEDHLVTLCRMGIHHQVSDFTRNHMIVIDDATIGEIINEEYHPDSASGD